MEQRSCWPYIERQLSNSQPRATTVIIDEYPNNYAKSLLYDKPPGLDYEGWVTVYKLATSDLKDIRTKRLIRIGDETVVQSFDAGRRDEDVASGANPTVMRTEGTDIRILEIQLIKAQRLPSGNGERPAVCYLYTEIRPFPSATVARDLASLLARRLEVSALSVVMREDTGSLIVHFSRSFVPSARRVRRPTKPHTCGRERSPAT